jgi:hypothetical protein
MAANDELDRLKRRLRREGAGPLTVLSNQMMTAIATRLRGAAQWLRAKGEEQPLITLLLAMQIGFVVGHWGPRRAKH